MKQEWTPTQREARALVEAWSWRGCRRCMVPVSLVLLGYLLLVVGDLRVVLILFPVLVVGTGALQLLFLMRRTGRLVDRVYPVGRVASIEALDAGLRMVNAVEAAEVSWDRYARPRPGAVVVELRDTVLGRPVLLPRQLVADEWLDRFGR